MARSVDAGKASKFIVLASVCVVVAALYLAQEVLIPLALAVLFSFLLAPLVLRLERLRLGRVASTLIVVFLALGLVGGLGYMVESQFVEVANELPQYREQIKLKIDHLRGASGALGKALKKVEETTVAVAPRTATSQPTSNPTSEPTTTIVATTTTPPPSEIIPPMPQQTVAPGRPVLPNVTPENPLPVRDYPETSPVKQLVEYVSVVLHPLATSGLVLVFVIFMLLAREDLRDRIIRLVGYGRLNLTTTALDDAASRISRYLLAQSLINASYGCCIAGGLWLIGHFLGSTPAHPGRGFPNVLLWGLLCGVFRFVPYIGPFLGAAGPLLVSFAFFEHSGIFFATLGLFVTIELIVSQAIEPLLYGSSTGMSALAVLVAAVFWTWLWGPIGLLLSTPLTAVLVVIGKYVPQLNFLDIMLGDEPVLEPPVRVYQRLIAQDQEEAAELARAYLKESSLIAVYDDVLLPAMALAEHDRYKGTLDDERRIYIRQAMRALVDELGDEARQNAQNAMEHKGAANVAQPSPSDDKATDAGGSANGKPVQGSVDAKSRDELFPVLPQHCTVNVVCLPAHDESDEVASIMFAQVLELHRYCVFPISSTALASEMVNAVEKHQAHAVIVSALPPAAVSHSRYLCKRLHGRFADLKMIVGLWTAGGDLQKAKERITCEGSVQLATTLRQAMTELHQIVQPAILAASTAAPEPSVAPQPVASNLAPAT